MHQTRWFPTGVLALVSLSCGACGSEPPSNNVSSTVRDSAGVTIVENGAAAPTRWVVDSLPVLILGANEEDENQALFRVTGAVILRDGRTVVVQSSPPMLRWYDDGGQFLFGTGRPGGGPGEFGPGEGAWIAELWVLPGDSIATWEHPARRMQVFDPSGDYVRSVVLELPAGMPERSYPQMVGRLTDGFVVSLNTFSEPGSVGELVREPLPYHRYAADGQHLGELVTLPGLMSFTSTFRFPDGQERRLRGRPPFSKPPVTLTRGDQFYYSSSDIHEITLFDTLGSVEAFIRQSLEPVVVTSDHIETYKAFRMETAPDDPDQRRQWQESLDTAPYPPSFPSYRRFRVDRTGMVWAQRYPAPGTDASTWSVFDETGIWTADVEIPASWNIQEIGADYVLAVLRDEFDVETVHRFPLARR